MDWWFLLVGAICLGIGIFIVMRRLRVLFTGTTVTGHIAHWERRADSEFPNTYFYFPHIAYRDRAGTEHVMRVDRGYNSEKWPPGHPFKVVHAAADPARAYAASSTVALVGPLALAAMGAAALAAVIRF